MQNVRSYSTQELLDRVQSLDTFTEYPSGYWLINIRSEEDAYDKYDDKFYLFKGKESVKVYLGTTNAGSTGLKKFNTYSNLGVAVLKSDTIIYDSHQRGLHRGKVLAYRQVKSFPYYRDANKDNKVDEKGKLYNDVIFANIHPASYIKGQDTTKEFIGGWSLACQVFANRRDFDEFMKLTENQLNLSLCILKEFDPTTTVVKKIKPLLTLSKEDVDNIVDKIKPILPRKVEYKVNEVQKIEKIVTNVVDIPFIKESPSKTTKNITISMLSASLLTFLFSVSSFINNIENLKYVIPILIFIILLVIIAIVNYRKSAKQSHELNLKKLELIVDPVKK